MSLKTRLALAAACYLCLVAALASARCARLPCSGQDAPGLAAPAAPLRPCRDVGGTLPERSSLKTAGCEGRALVSDPPLTTPGRQQPLGHAPVRTDH
jgi:hypothetical protein